MGREGQVVSLKARETERERERDSCVQRVCGCYNVINVTFHWLIMKRDVRFFFSSSRFEFLSSRVVSFNPLPKNGQELDCHYLI